MLIIEYGVQYHLCKKWHSNVSGRLAQAETGVQFVSKDVVKWFSFLLKSEFHPFGQIHDTHP